MSRGWILLLGSGQLRRSPPTQDLKDSLREPPGCRGGREPGQDSQACQTLIGQGKIGSFDDSEYASYPNKTGKNLPGESPLYPLHRITSSADAASKQRYDANDRVRELDCNASTPGASAAGKDCDEYPFRSSAEGAARYQYEGAEFKDVFSVRYIDPKENQEAGTRLGAWYHSDRILNWEAFTVTIGD
ncbi:MULTISPECIES: NucA/NucB deoxyribonuclease domain-containing protein [unclassified Streptomyces]|uniref:NucA/NucB deoxyribonuclease domain-containing protein n=1 Tax=unclassified Streptomyces TaxID=2593676 RepID=UPI000D19F780|nr:MULTISPECIES: NucA/NucB deoxyribonuclease domain-containing protein [unclassified Streptomyces]